MALNQRSLRYSLPVRQRLVRSPPGRLLSLLVTLVLVAVVFHLMLDPLVRQMLYPAPPIPVPSPPPSPLEEVLLDLPGGARAIGWAQAHPDPAGPAVAFFHGNGENLETMRMSGTFEQLAALGAHVLAIDYPGYGRAIGEPSEASLTAAGEAALAWLAERHPTSRRVVVGWSLGAAVAIRTVAADDEPRRRADAMSRQRRADALILLSAWSDLASLAAVHYPSWMVGLGIKDKYDSVAAAAGVEVPVLMIHGSVDELIPLAQGRKLHQALGDRATFVEVPGAGHNDLLARPVVWQELGVFLRPSQQAAGTAG